MIRVMEPGDLEAVLELNNAAVPAVNELDEESLARLVGMSDFARVVDHDGRVGALLITLSGSGHPYASENYAWFCDRETDFIYVDRIVVHPDLHGRGIGRSFYDALLSHAEGRTQRIFAEVNTRPRNHRSLDFHRRYGFRELGEREFADGTRSVAMLELRLPRAGGDRP